MIRVDRGPEPYEFAVRSADWQRRFAESRIRNPDLTPGTFWNQIRAEVRPDAQILYEAFQGKCAFCESRMAHVSSPHIEHYRPKSNFFDQMFVWQNWLLSCGRCNDKKWAHFPDCGGQPCLLDPTTENPNENIDFLGAQILDKTPRGAETIKLIGLDRTPLVEERARWLMTIEFLLLLMICHLPEIKQEVRQLLIWSMQPDAPYTAMTYSYLRNKAPGLANPKVPHPFVEPHNQLERIANLVEQYSDQLSELV